MSDICNLRVLLSSELPEYASRTDEYYYLLYDYCRLLHGKNYYSDPFFIAEKIPEKPISGSLYILLNGEVHFCNDDYTTRLIARINSDQELKHLKGMGSMYMVHASHRYMDPSRRVMMLPYYNGTYMLTARLAGDLKFNENTVLRYDPRTEEFYIDGEHEIEDFRCYQSSETESVITEIYERCIHSHVKISGDPSNMIQTLPGGLFVKAGKFASSSEFAEFRRQYSDYKSILGSYMQEIEEAVENAKVSIGEYTIARMVKQALDDYHSDMVDLFTKYEEIQGVLDRFEEDAKGYVDHEVEDAKNQIIERMKRENQWGSF